MKKSRITFFFLFYTLAIATGIFSTFIKIDTVLALEAGWTINTPSSVTLPSVAWGLADQQTTMDFASPIIISNSGSTTQGFTAQVTSTELIHSTNESLFVGYIHLEMKTGAVTTDQPNGISTPLNNTYSAFSGILATSDALNFMVADVQTRNAGSWEITPTIRLTIPAKQKAGTYNATMTFSLI